MAFAFRGILPQIIALGFLGITLLAFAHLLTVFLKKGSTIPNRYGAAPIGLFLREVRNAAVVLTEVRR